jgi:hypothetical protein
MKLTPWFPANVKPVRVGVYQVRDTDTLPWYRRWDGAHWHIGAESVRIAAATSMPIDSQLPWRGLAEEPK